MKELLNKIKGYDPMVYVIWGIIALLIYSLIFGGCQYNRGFNDAVNSMKADTVEKVKVKWDTTFIDKPVPEYQYVVEHKTDTFKLIKHDTVDNTAVVEIPITQKRYHEDSLYTAWVSGYKPNLDSIEVYPKTVTHTTTITKTFTRKPKITLSAGLSYGYSIKSKKVEPQVGITVGIPLKNIY